MCDVVLGTQWGDEGKGKLVDFLCKDVDVCARCQGGNNAGHTICIGDTKYEFHILPSGLLNPNCKNLIGSGVVIHIPSLLKEIKNCNDKGLKCEGRLYISSRAHLVFDFHQLADKLKEKELQKDNKELGTTGKGIGPSYTSKYLRSGLRIHDLVSPCVNSWEEFKSKVKSLFESTIKVYGDLNYDIDDELKNYENYREYLKPYIVDSIDFIHQAIKQKKKILIEGANALMLDIDFGTYPYVTSSSTSIGGVLTGLGIPPSCIANIFGVIKSYTTRVGSGPFPTEQLNEYGRMLQEKGCEFGVTTKRKRRCGWLDLVVLKHSSSVNGYTALNITKLDVLDDFDKIKIGVCYKLNNEKLSCYPDNLNILSQIEVEYVEFPGWKQDISKIKNYNDLPTNAKNYCNFIEKFLNIPIKWIGNGPLRSSMLILN